MSRGGVFTGNLAITLEHVIDWLELFLQEGVGLRVGDINGGLTLTAELLIEKMIEKNW